MIDQIAPFNVNGAGSALGISNPAQAARTGIASGANGADFGTVLGRVISDSADVLRTAESAAIKGVMGQASVQEVVESVLAAEQTLQAAIAIRDKVTAAYLELSRMAI